MSLIINVVFLYIGIIIFGILMSMIKIPKLWFSKKVFTDISIREIFLFPFMAVKMIWDNM